VRDVTAIIHRNNPARLKPELKWSVDTGSMRQDSIANQLIEIGNEPSYACLHEFQESQKTELESEVRCPDPSYFSIIEWNIVMPLKPESSGPDAMPYENWRQLEPELIPFMVKAFSKTITSGNFDPGKLEVRPFSLLNGMIKILHRLVLLRMIP
jgi:hypothetical protein